MYVLHNLSCFAISLQPARVGGSSTQQSKVHPSVTTGLYTTRMSHKHTQNNGTALKRGYEERGVGPHDNESWE